MQNLTALVLELPRFYAVDRFSAFPIDLSALILADLWRQSISLPGRRTT